MGQNSKIEWCDHTFNPWYGCTKVSAGCANCYAETMMSTRFKKVAWGKGQPRILTDAANWKLPLRWDKKAHTANIRALADGFKNAYKAFTPEWKNERVKFNRPKVFCASLADVFDEEVSWEWKVKLFNLIRKTKNLDWLILTKRPRLAKEFFDQYKVNEFKKDSFYSNIWIGTSVENQAAADERIPLLLEIPAAKRFLSMEPLLGPVDFYKTSASMPLKDHPWRSAPILTGIDWVIVGGESGKQAQPMNPEWVRSIRNQCQAANVKFFFKQWGEWYPNCLLNEDGSRDESTMWFDKIGKDKSGRLLDGVEYNNMPEVE